VELSNERGNKALACVEFLLGSGGLFSYAIANVGGYLGAILSIPAKFPNQLHIKCHSTNVQPSTQNSEYLDPQ
jgi:hypothetical protein